jgi:AraC-like DNA-binding protein
MEIVFSFNAVIHLIAASFGLLSGLIILYSSIRYNHANQPLAIGQIIVSIAIFVNFSLISKLIFYWPFMYRMGHVCILVFITMPYFNVVFHTQANRHWRWKDIFHAIPLLIFLVDYGHVLLLSNAEKLLILRYELLDLNLLGQFRQSRFIGPGFHEKFRSFLFSAYWVGQVILFVKWSKKPDAGLVENKIWKNWTIVYLVFQFGMFAPFYLSFLGLSSLTSYHVTNSFVVVWLLLSSLSLFFFPSLLYGKVYEKSAQKKKQRQSGSKPDYKEVNMGEAIQIIDFEMSVRQLFLTQGYSINDFAKDIQVPVYQISRNLNMYKEMNFLDFINQKRIQYCIAKFQEGEWLNYSIESIATNCGFTNRNTFTRAFKKFHGCLPSEYIKQLLK